MNGNQCSHAPTIIFVSCFAALIVAFVIAAVGNGGGWCVPGEEPALCSRNWVNAAGNTLTGIVAILAAVLAFNQVQAARAQVEAARRQIDLSRIPAIRDRVTLLHEVDGAASRIEVHIRSARSYTRGMQITLNQANRLARFTRHWHGLIQQLRSVEERWRDLDNQQAKTTHDPLVEGVVRQVQDAAFDVMVHGHPAMRGATSPQVETPDHTEDGAAHYYDWLHDDPGQLSNLIDVIGVSVQELDQARRKIRDLRERLIAEMQAIEARG